ncbi:MAG: hypothetical protein IJV40_11005 [Oscillospiraceae bacterium]|nr:hypothetical protein [Oscillospiraceae bacterium]
MVLPFGSIAYLRENITEETTEDGVQYSADEYTVTSGLSFIALRRKVEADFAHWLSIAKEQEEEETEADIDLLEIAADHEERLCLLELGV